MDNSYEGMEIEDDPERTDTEEMEFVSGFDEAFGLNNFLGGKLMRRRQIAAESSSSGQGGTEVNLNLALGGAPSSSSSASAVPEREIPDHDSHNKRPKVHSFSL